MKQILIITMIAAMLHGCGGNGKPITLGVEDFATVAGQNDVRLVDVRTAEEYAEGHLFGAENIDVKDSLFGEHIKAIGGKVAVYCRGGRRSLKAAELLTAQGCTVYNLDGGIQAWRKAGRKTTKVETDVFVTESGKLVKIHALLHASICIEHDGRVIYIDPVAQLRERMVDYSLLPKADMLLVTHEHFDHFDTATLRKLYTPDVEVAMNRRCAEMFTPGLPLDNGDSREFSCGSVDAVPAYNITAEHLQFHPKGRDNGYVLTIDGLRIYIAGDTEDIPEMANLEDIDIAFLPCNQPFTMTPQQLVNAARMVKPQVLFPYHYGETDVSSIADSLPGIDVRIRHYE